MVFQISGSARSTIIGSVEENKNGLDALSERTEFTLILLRMAAGDVSLGSGAISTDRHS